MWFESITKRSEECNEQPWRDMKTQTSLTFIRDAISLSSARNEVKDRYWNMQFTYLFSINDITSEMNIQGVQKRWAILEIEKSLQLQNQLRVKLLPLKKKENKKETVLYIYFLVTVYSFQRRCTQCSLTVTVFRGHRDD